MSYTKTTWANDSSPYINATNLQNIEDGIEDAHTKLDRVFSPIDDQSAAANGTTDDSSEVQASIDAAEAEVSSITDRSSTSTYAVVDLQGKSYGISTPLTIDKPIILQNGTLIALSDFTASSTMITIGSGADGTVLQNLALDGGVNVSNTHYADGLIDNGAEITRITNVRGVHFNSYGLKLTEGGNVIVDQAHMYQWLWDGAGRADASLRTAKGIWIIDADAMLVNCSAAYCEYPLYDTGGFTTYNGCHFFNGAATSNIPSETYCVYLGAQNTVWDGANYIDNGAIKIVDNFSQNFTGLLFQHNSNGNETTRFELETSTASATGQGLQVIGCKYNGSVANVFQFTTTGSGTWATDKEITWIGNIESDGDSVWKLLQLGYNVEWSDGNYRFGNGAGGELMELNGSATSNRLYLVQSAGVNRWGWGANTSSDYTLSLYDSLGSFDKTIFSIDESSGDWAFNVPIQFKSYAKASLPSAATAGQMIYVTDDVGGAIPAFSDGTNWRRVTDRAVIA